MGWLGHLRIDYSHDGTRTGALDRHSGPLRVLQRLYPEGPGICHHVLVHPPGGVVGGDTLALDLTLAPASHALLTTPGATRFYRSAGEPATQTVQARLAAGARLEWLPMEAIAYRGCQVHNSLQFTLAPGAQMLGWDLLALGLPAAGEPFGTGRFLQQIELPGRWLERGVLDAADTRLMQGPLGLAGHSVLATLWLADGDPAAGGAGPGAGSLGEAAHVERLLEAARAAIEASAVAGTAGVTLQAPGLLVLRALAHRVEPAMALLKAVRAAWRRAHWGLADQPPRVWRT